MASPTTRANARFSTYSGAPSLHPSLAATMDTTDSQSSARNSQTTTPILPPHPSEKRTSRTMYHHTTNTLAATSTSTLGLTSTDPKKAADIKTWSGALERMQDIRLEKQRYVMNDSKTDEVAKLALSAKVERALARRMVGQDATFSTKACKEKRSVEVEAR